ncbi:DUF885 domain-containing protein [Lysobacter sp. GX 14042]|uniref:DUF885 domain-containing protein n=1 Tax=Lysobacter sp. GX 14042 TaxID=2907155 RepID=UPI001F42DE44|nr:DUF885 domain-containing protein [Lysobacter sp. GX 14042]MCE7032167.1 DUF885 domain-containing protein [Lysobacter sp. GX 14042]
MRNSTLALALAASFGLLAGCQAPATPAQDGGGTGVGATAGAEDTRFAEAAESLLMRALERSPEWSIYAGRYDNAGQLTIPDAARRTEDLAFARAALAELAAFDPEQLPAAQRIDHMLLVNHFESMVWYQQEFRDWAWDPSNYNVAGTVALLLNTPYADEDERLRAVMARLEHVPAYYEAARANIDDPTAEHVELAIVQSRGALSVFDDGLRGRIDASGLDAGDRDLFNRRIDAARGAIEGWIGWLEGEQQRLAASGDARSFRIGEALYGQKFAYDIQSHYTAAELYQRAVGEKERLHAQMDDITRELWPKYFSGTAMPEDRLKRVGMMIDHLAARHVERGEFVDEIKRQIPQLGEFVREHDLLDQDESRPLVVRETPEYMRGGGAGASISAPGPFNPTADTYYNVSPLDAYSDEQAESFLREYNHWVLQVLNIHEAIPGHYTQLLHANKSPSLVKSLLGNGAMIEGWGVYAERMMLEQGWGNQEPEMWLMYDKWNLRVVTNAILDYAVHVDGMTEDQAMDLLRREAFQEQTEAANKWRRVRLSQVQLASYFTGYAEIYDLREQRKAELGDAFSLKDFHNRFLSYGNAPVSAIAELMREQHPED